MIRQDSTTSLASAGRNTSRPGTAAQRGQLLDRLVGGAVLADADGVVGEDVHDRDLHQRGQAHGPPGVVGEDEEARPVAAAAWSAPSRWRWPPRRAPGSRGAGCARPDCRAGRRRRRRTSGGSWSTAQRSADPPMSQGMACARALSTWPEESRPANPLGSAGRSGVRPPSRRELRAAGCVRARRPGPDRARGTRRTVPPRLRRAARPRAPMPSAKHRRRLRGRRSRRPRAGRGSVSSPARPRPRTARRGPSGSPRPASRSRCGCARRSAWAARARLGTCGTRARPRPGRWRRRRR